VSEAVLLDSGILIAFLKARDHSRTTNVLRLAPRDIDPPIA
jgi:hypothetical protein